MKRINGMLLIFCLIFLTSCIDDSREIDHRSMIVGMGVDLVDKGENQEFLVTLQIPILLSGTTEGGASGSVKEFETFNATGETILDAVSQIEAQTPTVLFFGHLKVLMIGENVAKHGLGGVIDFCDRLPQVANQIFLLVIEKGSAKEFIEEESPLVTLPALYLNRFFQAEQKIARTKDVKLFEYRRDANMISRAATLPLANVDHKIVIEGMGVFKDHKLVAKLDTYEVGISELLKKNNVKHINYTTSVTKEEKDVKIGLSRGELKAKIRYEKDDPVKVTIDVKGEGEITEIGTVAVHVSQDLVEKASRQLEKDIKSLIEQTISKMKAKNVEPWLIGHRIWAMDPRYFESLDWDETGWRNSQIEVNVQFEIEHTGQKGFLGKKKIGR